MSYRIRTLHVFTSIGADGDEGVVAFWDPTRGWMPLVAADERRLESFRPMAQAIADKSGRHIMLARFTVREELDTIIPKGAARE